MMTADVLPDVDRKMVRPSDIDRIRSATELPPTTFEPRRAHSSLGKEHIQRMQEKPTWSAPRPLDWHLIAEATYNLISCEGQYHVLEQSWLSLLVERCHILHNRDDLRQHTGLVIGVTHHCVTIVRLQSGRKGDLKWWEFERSTEGDLWKHITISDLPSWWMAECEIVPPSVAAHRWAVAGGRHPGGCVIMLKSAPMPLLRNTFKSRPQHSP